MIRAASVEGSQDLRPVLQLMARNGIRFRVSEEAGNQVIWVSKESEVALCQEHLKRWEELRESGFTPIAQPSAPLSSYFSGKGAGNKLLAAVWYAPVTSLIILVAIVVALMTSLGAQVYNNSPLLYPNWSGGSALNPLSYLQILSQAETSLEYIRTLAPAFLHFGIIHIVFNVLWIWQLGRMIEVNQPKIVFILATVFIIYVGNTAQLLWSQSVAFGGLSGLVYGYLGFIWTMQTLNPQSRLRLPSSTIAILVGFMVLVAVVPLGFIANAAHIGGFIAGIIAGIPAALFQRGSRSASSET
ncbi:MAG: rhomboid family intramembrane serine protease [Pseudohongiellaceae bacterium]|nr:rhomboid family intramembrane serine protease [Pseudohongiellaceae bacterium]